MKEKTRKNNSCVLETLKALIVALIISLALVLLAALIIKLFNIPSDYIVVINQVIKSLSVLISALICFRLPNNGWLRGLLFGVLYIALAFVVFSLLDGQFKFGITLLNDLAIGSVTGIISGIIAVNLRK